MHKSLQGPPKPPKPAVDPRLIRGEGGSPGGQNLQIQRGRSATTGNMEPASGYAAPSPRVLPASPLAGGPSPMGFAASPQVLVRSQSQQPTMVRGEECAGRRVVMQRS